MWIVLIALLLSYNKTDGLASQDLGWDGDNCVLQKEKSLSILSEIDYQNLLYYISP